MYNYSAARLITEHRPSTPVAAHLPVELFVENGMPELTQARVKELFDYDPETGIVTRIIQQIRAKKGDIVGCLGNRGYLMVKINQKMYVLHRVIWLWAHGAFPKNQIDHINHDGTDNRIANLREATNQENSKNMSISRKNTSGVTGVCWRQRSNSWSAQIQITGRSVHIGTYQDFNDAVAARKLAEKKYGFHKNHGL